MVRIPQRSDLDLGSETVSDDPVLLSRVCAQVPVEPAVRLAPSRLLEQAVLAEQVLVPSEVSPFDRDPLVERLQLSQPEGGQDVIHAVVVADGTVYVLHAVLFGLGCHVPRSLAMTRRQ